MREVRRLNGLMSNEYLGFKEVVLEDEDANSFFSSENKETYDCLENEYVVAKDFNDTIIGLKKYNGKDMVEVPYKVICSRFADKVKPRNIQQQLAIDMLYDKKSTIKVITGKFGTGKDFLMSSAAIDLIEKGIYDKIVYVRNNIEVKDSKPIGYLPGSHDEKLLPFAMPLADHLGGIDGLELMVDKGRVEIVHLGFIRGRDIKNSIIMCSEAENLTVEHIQLLIGRVGEGSTLWLNGDFKQCDAKVFRENSGLMRAVERLKGHPRFAYIRLLKTERSETAAMADLLD